MEEKKNTQEKKKMTYEELQRAASELFQQNQQLMSRMQQMQASLDDTEFNRMSFLVSMLFKVVENSSSFNSDFVVSCTETIESALTEMMPKPASDTNNDTKNEA